MTPRLRSLRGRLAAVFAVLALALVVAGVLGVSAFNQLLDARRQLVDRADPALAATDRLTTDLVDQETGVRGYALGRQAAFLEPYDRGQADQARVVGQLRVHAAALPGVTVLLDDVLARAGAWRTKTASPTIAAVRRGDSSRRAKVLAPEGKRRFDAIRTAMAALEGRIGDLRTRARHRLDSDTTRLQSVIGGGLLLVVLVGILLWVALRRWVSGPLIRLGEGADRVAEGELDHVIEPDGPAELHQLALRIEQMRSRIVQDLARVEQSGVELRRSNAELEQFAYVASHDLQEPLRKVAGFCELLERRYGDQLDDRAHQYIEFAVDGATRMQRLILDLLAFSRVGRTTESFEDVDLGAVLGAALANLEDRTTESGAEITQDELPTVRGDASLLTAMFQNLIGNAIKFRSEAPPRIAVGCEREGEDWVITVADNGIGIEAEYAERVFVIFQRLHAKDQYEGTGIGLSLCKKIVEFHGGQIAVSPREDGGTLARLTLPVNASAEAHV